MLIKRYGRLQNFLWGKAQKTPPIRTKREKKKHKSPHVVKFVPPKRKKKVAKGPHREKQ